MKLHWVALLLVLLLCGCRAGNKQLASATPAVNDTAIDFSPPGFNNKADTSNQYIYDFMKVVIADQKLDLNHGVAGTPEQKLYTAYDYRAFLTELLIDTSEHDTALRQEGRPIVIRATLKKCLTQGDIDYMLLQRKNMANFYWNNGRLGFNFSDAGNYYSFSVPVFSKDKRKAIIMINDLCPGLCGTGYTLLFTKKGKRWDSEMIGFPVYY